MNCQPVKSREVLEQLCGILYYPGNSSPCKFAKMCNKMYERWLREYEDVRRLEGEELPSDGVQDKKVKIEKTYKFPSP